MYRVFFIAALVLMVREVHSKTCSKTDECEEGMCVNKADNMECEGSKTGNCECESNKEVMNTSKSLGSTADELSTCVICFEGFEEPKLISCYHTFCRECLDKYINSAKKNGKFPCPICRTEIGVPTNGAADFQTNFYIPERKSVGATGSSADCQNAKAIIKSMNVDDCGIHPDEKIALFCEDCEIALCRDCKIEEHDGHKSVRLVDIVEDLVAQAAVMMKRATHKTNRAKEFETEIKKKLRDLEAKREETKAEIKERKRILDEKVLKEATSTLVRLSDVTKDAQEELHAELQKITSTKTQLQTVCEMMQTTIKGSDPVQILYMIPIVRESLDVLSLNVDVGRLLPDITLSKTVAPDAEISKSIGTVTPLKKPLPLVEDLCFLYGFEVHEKNSGMYVKAILPMSEAEVWVVLRSAKSREKTSILRKVNFREGRVEIINSCRFNGLVSTIAPFVCGAIALSVPFENKISLLENEERFIDFAYLKTPTGITTFQNDLYVCSVESLDYKAVERHHANRVVVLTREGLIKSVIEFYKGDPLFSYPGRVSVNYNGDIWIADFKDVSVTVLDANGERKHKSRFADDDGTMVADVICDTSGYVLIDTSQGLFIKNSNGKTVHRFVEQAMGDVVAMAAGQSGTLWVGVSDCKIAIWKYTKS